MNSPTIRSSLLFWLIVLAVGSAFFATEHDLKVSLQESFTSTEDEMEVAADGGDVVRRVAFLGLGGLGLVLLLLPADRRIAARAPNSSRGEPCGTRPHEDTRHSQGGCRFDTPWVIPLALFLGWCGLSVLWSDDASMTLRRLSVLGCLALAAGGLARQLALRDIVGLVLIVSTAYLCLGVVAELRNGTLSPASSEFRFAGTLHPNTQGLNLAILCLSSWCLARGAARGRTWLYGLFAVGFVFLVLTKSRTSLAGLIAAIGMIWLIRTALPSKLAVGLAGLWLVCVAVLVSTLAGIDAGNELAQLALLGREEEADSLTGRLPLWTELSNWVALRPLTGYGYDSFWTADRIDAVSAEMKWGIREAHSAWFDWVLSVGLIGAGLLLTWVLAAVWRAAGRFRATARPELGFIFGWAVFCLINASTESAMMMPLYATFVTGCGLVSVLLSPACAFASAAHPGPAGRPLSVSDVAGRLLPGRSAAGGLS
jgi:O-antigen ligase